MSSPNMSGGREIQYQRAITVGQVEYKCMLLPPERAFRWSVRLMKVMGEPMAQMAGKVKSRGTQKPEDAAAEALPLAVRAMCEKLDVEESLEFVQAMIATCVLENKAINFTAHFQGRMGQMLALVTEVAKFQFADFFEYVEQLFQDDETSSPGTEEQKGAGLAT